jgi:hypothetical protein
VFADSYLQQQYNTSRRGGCGTDAWASTCLRPLSCCQFKLDQLWAPCLQWGTSISRLCWVFWGRSGRPIIYIYCVVITTWELFLIEAMALTSTIYVLILILYFWVHHWLVSVELILRPVLTIMNIRSIQIRAANLSGDCAWKRELLRGNTNLQKQHQVYPN